MTKELLRYALVFSPGVFSDIYQNNNEICNASPPPPLNFRLASKIRDPREAYTTELIHTLKVYMIGSVVDHFDS